MLNRVLCEWQLYVLLEDRPGLPVCVLLSICFSKAWDRQRRSKQQFPPIPWLPGRPVPPICMVAWKSGSDDTSAFLISSEMFSETCLEWNVKATEKQCLIQCLFTRRLHRLPHHWKKMREKKMGLRKNRHIEIHVDIQPYLKCVLNGTLSVLRLFSQEILGKMFK